MLSKYCPVGPLPTLWVIADYFVFVWWRSYTDLKAEQYGKKKLRHARTKIRNSAFGWHWLSMKSTRGEANKMSVLFRQNWVITQFRSCWGIFKTIVVAFGTLRPRQNLIIKLTVWSLVFDWSRRTDGILAATWAFIFLCLKAVKKRKHEKNGI